VRLDDELPSAEHPRRRRDEGCAEADQDVRRVEQVHQRPDHGERQAQGVLELHAHVLLRARQVQEHRVHEQRQQARRQEDLVPQVDQVPARVQVEAAARVYQRLQLLREGARQHPVPQARGVPAGLLRAAAPETQPASPWIVSLAAVLPVVLQRARFELLEFHVIVKSETTRTVRQEEI
jgi:hypothetical protein